MRDELGGVGIVSGWGLTEAPILTMARTVDPDDKLATTEGRAMPGVQLRAVSPADGSVVGVGVEGELQAQAPQLMRGYLDASLDADAFVDGWFRTGDLGVIDEQGYVRITGRLKDVIIRKGENVSAKEVEDLLFEHEKVADVAVIGLPDADRGELVCAVHRRQDRCRRARASSRCRSTCGAAACASRPCPSGSSTCPRSPATRPARSRRRNCKQQFGKP